MGTSRVLGMEIQATTLSRASKSICEYLPRLRGKYITFVNVHTLVTAKENEKYRQAQKEAVMSFADGYPIARYQRHHGYPKAERVAGPDVMTEIFTASVAQGYTHYFYGSTPETLEKLQQKLCKKYPGIKIVGAYAPDKNLDIETTDFTYDYACINREKSDFIWVGLGAPKQEYWMQKAAGKVTGVMLGVGAGFDFFAGVKKRAPRRMQKMGLEWLYRLLQEPRRLGGRYIRTNLKFIWMCIKEKLCK